MSTLALRRLQIALVLAGIVLVAATPLADVTFRDLAPAIVALAASLTVVSFVRARLEVRTLRWFDLSPICLLVIGLLLFVSTGSRASEAGSAAFLVLLLVFMGIERRRKTAPSR